MTDEIAGPKAGGNFIAPRDHLSHLVIFTKVHKVEVRYDQKRKADGEVLTVDFHCFNCDKMAPPEELLLGHPWVGQKVQRDGRLTLGYITQLAATNGNADGAFVLSDPAPADFPNVQRWWDGVKAAQIAAPAQQQPAAPPAASSPWDSAPATPAPAQGGWDQPTPPPAAAQPDPWAVGPPPAATPPPPPPAQPQGPPTREQVAAMPLDGVRALIASGVLTLDQVRTVRQDV